MSKKKDGTWKSEYVSSIFKTAETDDEVVDRILGAPTPFAGGSVKYYYSSSGTKVVKVKPKKKCKDIDPELFKI